MTHVPPGGHPRTVFAHTSYDADEGETKGEWRVLTAQESDDRRVVFEYDRPCNFCRTKIAVSSNRAAIRRKWARK